MWIIQTLREYVRGTSNLLVANMYWMLAFQIYVFAALLSEETPNRISEIWESFLSWMFSAETCAHEGE